MSHGNKISKTDNLAKFTNIEQLKGWHIITIQCWNAIREKKTREIWHFIQILVKSSVCHMETKYQNMSIWPNYPFQNIFRCNMILLCNVKTISWEKKNTDKTDILLFWIPNYQFVPWKQYIQICQYGQIIQKCFHVTQLSFFGGFKD